MKRYKNPAEIKLGVVGYGGAFNMGKSHILEAGRAGISLAAVTDVDPKRRAQAEVDFPGVQTYATLAELLKKSDANLIIIITPHNTHAKLVLQSLKAGRHVVCEKPLAITTAECDAMIAMARRKGVMLSTYHNRHWDGWAMDATRTIRSGAIGDVVRIEAHMGGWGEPGAWWRGSKSISGGILYDWGVHVAEYCLQLIDDEMVEISGFTREGVWAPTNPWKKDTVEDEAEAIVRFKSGRWLKISFTNIDNNPKGNDRNWVEVLGTKGTYMFGGGGWTLITREGQDLVTRKGAPPEGEGWRFYQNVADHLVKGTPLVITAEWARRCIHILDYAIRSAKAGRALAAKYG